MSKKKNAWILGCLGLLLCIFAVSVTFAWFTDYDNAQNDIKLGRLGIDIIETSTSKDAIQTEEGIRYTDPLVIGVEKSKIVDIKNTEDLSVYLRVAVKKVWMDKDGQVLSDKDYDKIKINGIDQNLWIEKESGEQGLTYYYLKSQLKSGESANLFRSFLIENSFDSNEESLAYSHLKSQIIITASAIQADDGLNAIAEQNWDFIRVENDQLVSVN